MRKPIKALGPFVIVQQAFRRLSRRGSFQVSYILSVLWVSGQPVPMM